MAKVLFEFLTNFKQINNRTATDNNFTCLHMKYILLQCFTNCFFPEGILLESSSACISQTNTGCSHFPNITRSSLCIHRTEMFIRYRNCPYPLWITFVLPGKGKVVCMFFVSLRLELCLRVTEEKVSRQDKPRRRMKKGWKGNEFLIPLWYPWNLNYN